MTANFHRTSEVYDMSEFKGDYSGKLTKLLGRTELIRQNLCKPDKQGGMEKVRAGCRRVQHQGQDGRATRADTAGQGQSGRARADTTRQGQSSRALRAGR